MSLQLVNNQTARVGGVFPAENFAYGVNPQADPGVVLTGNTTTGAGAVIVVRSPQPFLPARVGLPDGSWIEPYATTASITVVDANQETVTPTAVSINSDGTVSITGDFTNTHGQGALVTSGTVGLQEAINAASAAGGGVVAVDSAWTNLGGTTAILNAATMASNVSIRDNRGPLSAAYSGSTDALKFPAQENTAEITSTGVNATTLATPGANDDGKVLKVISTTAHAHTITAASGKIVDGASSAYTTVTFAAYAGANVTLQAISGFWVVLGNNAGTLS